VKRILLIEDDAGAQLLYRNRLTDLGYEVVVSGTGAMGLVEARSAPFDLFLVDIGLGNGIDGYVVCRRLKTIPEFHGVPVVLISGHVKSQEDLHRGYEAGCQSFLVKGDLMLLEDIVRAMLRIKSLQDDLAFQNRLLDERNRGLEAERVRNADLVRALSTHKGLEPHGPGRLEGLMLVDEEGVVHSSDRGARDLFGGNPDGRHLAQLAPDSRLEAVVRNARTELHDGVRFEVPERLGRAAHSVAASIHPFVPHPERPAPTLRLVLLREAGRARASGARDEGSALRREWGPLVELARVHYRPAAFLGARAAAARVREQLVQLARGDEPVLLTGPRGSGKAFCARVLHYSGPRSGPLVVLPCRAFGAEALEHELFAGEDGALARAQGGTLLLEDVERLPQGLQARLGETLAGGRLGPAGERLDARVLATSSEPGFPSEPHGFDAELARRFVASRLEVPSLVERSEAIPALCAHFLARHTSSPDVRFDEEALWLLGQHTWPENVRELERVVQEACAAARGAEIGVDDLPRAFVELHRERLAQGQRPPPRKSGGGSIEQVLDEVLTSLSSTLPLLAASERLVMEYALRVTRGDKLAAARLLQVGKSTFYRKLKEYGL
jgi:DNA-binding NtrC family response regulator